MIRLTAGIDVNSNLIHVKLYTRYITRALPSINENGRETDRIVIILYSMMVFNGFFKADDRTTTVTRKLRKRLKLFLDRMLHTRFVFA